MAGVRDRAARDPTALNYLDFILHGGQVYGPQTFLESVKQKKPPDPRTVEGVECEIPCHHLTHRCTFTPSREESEGSSGSCS